MAMKKIFLYLSKHGKQSQSYFENMSLFARKVLILLVLLKLSTLAIPVIAQESTLQNRW